MLRVRHALTLIQRDELTRESVQGMIREPYFVPAATPLLSQIQNFQEHEDRVSLVVDEYGELLGLVTPDDIIEEIVGELNATTTELAQQLSWDEDGSTLVEGMFRPPANT